VQVRMGVTGPECAATLRLYYITSCHDGSIPY